MRWLNMGTYGERLEATQGGDELVSVETVEEFSGTPGQQDKRSLHSVMFGCLLPNQTAKRSPIGTAIPFSQCNMAAVVDVSYPSA